MCSTIDKNSDQSLLLKLKICDQLSMLVKVYNNKNEYCSEIKIPDTTKVYLVVNISSTSTYFSFFCHYLS